MDYIARIEKRLDLPRVDKEQVIRELRGHFEEITAAFLSSGMSPEEAEREAECRMGEASKVAAELCEAHRRKGKNLLFHPRDFIASSIFWGFWAGGVMAGMNEMRMGNRRRGYWIVASALVSQVAFLGLLAAANRAIGASGGPVAAHALPEPEISLNARWIIDVLAVWTVNAVAGYALMRWQSPRYADWQATHPLTRRERPYLAWWVSLLAIIGAIVTITLTGVFVYHLY